MLFISDCESKLALFVSVYGRQPINGEEFVKWCELVEANSSSLNSRRDFTKNITINDTKQH